MQLVDRQRAHLRDAAASDEDVQRFGAELGADARRALLRALVLPQEDADVLLVPLLLEVLEEREDPGEAAAARPEELLARALGQITPGRVHRDALALRVLGERAALVLVARRRPRRDRAVAQGALGVGDDERLVVLEDRAEAVAGRAGAARIVERE